MMKDVNANRSGYKETKVGWIPEERGVSVVGDCCVMKNELRLPISKGERAKIRGNFRYFGPTGVLDYINGYRIDGTYALIGEDGDHFLKYSTRPMTILVSGKFNLNNHAHLIEGGDTCRTEWFYTYFLHRSIRAFLTRQGAGRYKLNKESLKSLSIALPPLPEQKKIAEILSTCDEVIEKTAELIDAKKRQKKALMQQLLSGKKRLPGFEGEWETYRFSDVFARVRRKNIQQCQNNLTISGQHGLINQEDYFNKRIAAKDVSGYYLIKKGELAYNKSYCKGYPLGAIKMLVRYAEGVVSTLYICFNLKPKTGDSGFIRHFFESSEFNHELYSIAQEGARNHGLLNVSPDDFFNTRLRLPEIEEQCAIREVLDVAEGEVRQQEGKLSTLKQQKKGLMQKLLTGQIRVTA